MMNKIDPNLHFIKRFRMFKTSNELLEYILDDLNTHLTRFCVGYL